MRRRFRPRRGAALVKALPPADQPVAFLPWHVTGESFQAPEPARRDAGRAVKLFGARQIYFRCRGGLHKIMRRLTDLPFRLAHAQLRPHRARQPRAGFRHGRPNGFIKGAQNHHIGLNEARFKRPQYGQARLTRRLAANILAHQPHIEKCRKIRLCHGRRQGAMTVQCLKQGG